jgi:VanZ family protein
MPANKNKPRALLFFRYWLPVIIYAGLIFYLSSLPGKDIPLLFPYQDVVAHIIEYACFSLLINRALKANNPSLLRIGRFWSVFLIAIVYAVSDEFHQSFVPNRFPSLLDIAYDGLGIFMASILYR